MSTAEGRYHLVLNGEIYNYRELRKELEAAGDRFCSNSDTEVLLLAFSRWGKAVLPRLIGMFAFAILDVAQRTVFIARDCFGIKPLYYRTWSGGFACASEIKTLLELPGLSASVEPGPLFNYLRFGITDLGEDTFFRDIKRLPPAHYVEISLARPDQFTPCRYWDVDLDRTSELTLADAAEQMRELFLDSVRIHLRSDVPVGAALSGGIDSSSLIAAIRTVEPTTDLHVFSYIASDPALSEERWVDVAASAVNATVHKVYAAPYELKRDLETMIRIQEEPFASTSMYAQYRVFESARNAGIKVMIDGQGADELLGGYNFFVGARLASLITTGHWMDAARLWSRAAGAPGNRRLLLWAGEYAIPAELQAPFRRLVRQELLPSWLNKSWFEERGISAVPMRTSSGANKLRSALYQTLATTSLPMLLRYEDRNSMAHSIESRVPFLTQQLADFALSLPERYLVDESGTTKAIFRKAMEGLTPPSILNRKDKIGFATPERAWLRQLEPWVDQILASEDARSLSMIDWDAVRRQWNRIRNAATGFNIVWRLVNAVSWFKQFNVSTQ